MIGPHLQSPLGKRRGPRQSHMRLPTGSHSAGEESTRVNTKKASRGDVSKSRATTTTGTNPSKAGHFQLLSQIGPRRRRLRGSRNQSSFVRIFSSPLITSRSTGPPALPCLSRYTKAPATAFADGPVPRNDQEAAAWCSACIFGASERLHSAACDRRWPFEGCKQLSHALWPPHTTTTATGPRQQRRDSLDASFWQLRTRANALGRPSSHHLQRARPGRKGEEGGASGGGAGAQPDGRRPAAAGLCAAGRRPAVPPGRRRAQRPCRACC